jgi:hypothetical protein
MKPHLVVNLSGGVDPATVAQWLDTQRIRVLNGAGPRESEAPGIYSQAKTLLLQVFSRPGVIGQ